MEVGVSCFQFCLRLALWASGCASLHEGRHFFFWALPCIGWMARLKKQCNTSEPVPVSAKKRSSGFFACVAIAAPAPPEFQCWPQQRTGAGQKGMFFSQPRALELWSPTTLRFGGEGSADCRGETSEERFFRRHRTQYIMLRVLGPGRLRGFCVSELCNT